MNIIENEFLNKTIFRKYKILKLEGKGAFSAVFSAKNIINNQLVAIKVQNKIYNIGDLEKEAYYLFQLKGIGIPKMISYGNYRNYNILVEELLGKTIGELFKQNINKSNIIRLKDLAMSAIQLIDRIQFIHSNYLLHLDIKPSNFLFGKSDNSLIYIIDFGMAKKYRSSRTGKHIKFSKNNYFAGNLKYSSINTMKGIQPSRRDDLESLGYMIIDLFQQLPWENLKCNNDSDLVQKIYTAKSLLSIKMLCKDLPKEMNEYMIYVKSLKFEEEPNYIYLTRIFELILKKINKINDLNFSWIDKVLRNNNEKKLSQNNKRKKTSPFSKIFQKIKSKIESNEKDITSQVKNNRRIYSQNKEKLKFHERDIINIKENKKIFSTKSSAEKNKNIINFIKINPNNNNKNKNYSRNIKTQKLSLRCPSKLSKNKNISKNEVFSSSNSIRKNLILKTHINYHPTFKNNNRSYKVIIKPFINNENSKINKIKNNNICNKIRIRKKVPCITRNSTNNSIIRNELMNNFNEKSQEEFFLKNFTKDIFRQNIMYKSKLI